MINQGALNKHYTLHYTSIVFRLFIFIHSCPANKQAQQPRKENSTSYWLLQNESWYLVKRNALHCGFDAAQCCDCSLHFRIPLPLALHTSAKLWSGWRYSDFSRQVKYYPRVTEDLFRIRNTKSLYNSPYNKVTLCLNMSRDNKDTNQKRISFIWDVRREYCSS